MAQKITLKIGGHSYSFKAETPEAEQIMRLASADLNKKLDRFTRQYPAGQEIDRLSFVALNLGVEKISRDRKLAELKGEVDALKRETDVYIESIGKK